MESRPERASRQPFAQARNTRSSTPSHNPFDSLENETTQAVLVSPELLGQTREEESGAGATKAYEVPPELLELARTNKAKRAAARRALQAADAGAEAPPAPEAQSAEIQSSEPAPEHTPEEVTATVFAESPVTATTSPKPSVPPQVERVPAVIVAEGDIARPSAAPFELVSMPAAANKAVPNLRTIPDFSGRAARKRAVRLILAAVCLAAICAVGALCGRLMRDGQLLSAPAEAVSRLF